MVDQAQSPSGRDLYKVFSCQYVRSCVCEASDFIHAPFFVALPRPKKKPPLICPGHTKAVVTGDVSVLTNRAARQEIESGEHDGFECPDGQVAVLQSSFRPVLDSCDTFLTQSWVHDAGTFVLFVFAQNNHSKV